MCAKDGWSTLVDLTSGVEWFRSQRYEFGSPPNNRFPWDISWVSHECVACHKRTEMACLLGLLSCNKIVRLKRYLAI